MHFAGVFNRSGGTFRTMNMDAFCDNAVRIFAEHGHQLDCRVVEGKDLLEALEAAAAEGEALLVGGGDGTISAAAGVAFHHKIPLAVLPAGTMNLFARSLHLPLVLDEALVAAASGEVARVDIATANGRPFVHQFSVGIHTRLVRMRENLPYHSRIGKMIAGLRAIRAAVAHPPNFWAEVWTPRGVERRNASGITITNNPMGEGHIPHADTLDRGVLGVYIANPMSTLALLRLCVGVLVGKWKASPLVSEREVAEVSLLFPRRKSSAQAVIDGELIDLRDRIDLKIHPGALMVVVPAVAKSAMLEAEAAA